MQRSNGQGWAMLVRMMVMSGPDDGLELEFPCEEEGITIGRRDDCDVCIPFDTSVSRLHARLIIQDSQLWLKDENSRNGTFYGRQRVKGHSELPVGELFKVGNTWLRVQSVVATEE